jgi:hypothetical protein
MSGSGPSGLNSRIYTNSFAYRNNQAYAPFYEMQLGKSFYNLSVPQYSSTTYNSLAYQGGGPGSNSRIGRFLRINNIDPTPFVPPITPHISIRNSSFALSPTGGDVDSNGYITTDGTYLVIKPDTSPPHKVNDWESSVGFDNEIRAEKKQDHNAIYFRGEKAQHTLNKHFQE